MICVGTNQHILLQFMLSLFVYYKCTSFTGDNIHKHRQTNTMYGGR